MLYKRYQIFFRTFDGTNNTNFQLSPASRRNVPHSPDRTNDPPHNDVVAQLIQKGVPIKTIKKWTASFGNVQRALKLYEVFGGETQPRTYIPRPIPRVDPAARTMIDRELDMVDQNAPTQLDRSPEGTVIEKSHPTPGALSESTSPPEDNQLETTLHNLTEPAQSELTTKTPLPIILENFSALNREIREEFPEATEDLTYGQTLASHTGVFTTARLYGENKDRMRLIITENRRSINPKNPGIIGLEWDLDIDFDKNEIIANYRVGDYRKLEERGEKKIDETTFNVSIINGKVIIMKIKDGKSLELDHDERNFILRSLKEAFDNGFSALFNAGSHGFAPETKSVLPPEPQSD